MTTETPFERIIRIMRRLRAPDGCPWDREQDLHSLKPFLIEEAYEVLEAMSDEDPDRHREELGDLLFQIVFQAQIRAENGDFGLEDVAESLSDKLTRRHPHVFESGAQLTRDEVRQNWDRIKAEERDKKGQDLSAIAGVPKALPALLRADRTSKKAAAVGFDWPNYEGVRAKVTEELEEVEEAITLGEQAHIQHEVGDLLLAVVNLARHLNVEPETALQDANTRFESRFRLVEQLAALEGSSVRKLGLERLEELWQDAKSSLGGGSDEPTES